MNKWNLTWNEKTFTDGLLADSFWSIRSRLIIVNTRSSIGVSFRLGLPPSGFAASIAREAALALTRLFKSDHFLFTSIPVLFEPKYPAK